MQNKKNLLATTALLAVTICLFISAKITPTPVSAPKKACTSCCKNSSKDKSESLWNFVTKGILHLSV
ncbi:MAG: hypothetical protein ABIP30_02570 [Ferruginibacter sp.]